MSDYRRQYETAHHTVVFNPFLAMDDAGAAGILRGLGVVADWSGSDIPGLVQQWAACGLRSDGTVELWAIPAAGTGTCLTPDGGLSGIRAVLSRAGVPYIVYVQQPGTMEKSP